jgi:TolB-like protein
MEKFQMKKLLLTSIKEFNTNKISFGIVFVILLFLNCFTVFARDTLAILPFSGGRGGDGETIAELFMFDPTINTAFIPIPRTSITRAMQGERIFQLGGGMTDPDRAVHLARELGAKYVIAGNIARLGDRNLLVIGIINTETLEQIAGAIETFVRVEEMPGKLPAMARNIVAAKNNDTSALPKLATTRVALSGGDESGDILAQILSVYLIQNRRFAVFPRTRSLEQVQNEWNNQLSGHTADENIVRIGAGEIPRFVLSCVARRLGGQTMFNATIIDLERGTQAAGASVNYATLNDGIDVMAELAILLTSSPGTERDRRIRELHVSQGRPIPVPGTTLADQFTWLRTNAASNTNYIIEINGNITLAPQGLTLPPGRGNVTVILRGNETIRTINLSATGNLFSVHSGVTLILDNNITLRGRSDNNRPLVVIENGGSLIMNSGSGITGNTGGGVRVNEGGIFTMHGGSISNNVGLSGGTARDGNPGERGNNGRIGSQGGRGGVGGVFNQGTFTMHGGTISRNTGGNGGRGGGGGMGGYYGLVHNGSGGNAGNGGTGGTGGVHNTGSFTFAIHGGIISGNTGGEGGLGAIGGFGGRHNNPVRGSNGRNGNRGTNAHNAGS